MKARYRNLFLLFGIAAIAAMLLAWDIDYTELWHNVRRAGWWFGAVMALWVFIYLFNALSWYYIIRSGERPSPVPFWKVYKLSISGFALNYATPFGLMGGEPYRIMELSPTLGTPRATSCVILYVMMHIFTHICFWLCSVLLFVCVYPVSLPMAILLAAVGCFCSVAIWFFMKGYKNGMVVRFFRWAGHLPFLGRRTTRFYEKRREALQKIDMQIAELHNQKRSTFYMSFLFEFTARFLTCLEVFFILKILTPHVNFIDCILIMAFTSLFSNMFFFSPMQLGAREGGFALAVSGMAMSGAFGVYTGLITRVREILWIAIGIALMKVGCSNGNAMDKVKGILFDYGGTLDTGGMHWAHVLWRAYQEQDVPVTEEQFREAYVYGERYLAQHDVIHPDDTFRILLEKKIGLQLEHLARLLPADQIAAWQQGITDYCWQHARQSTEAARQVLDKLKEGYRMALVTNFYGNMNCVLREFGLAPYFETVAESAVVGVSKPDPALWKYGMDALKLQPEEICVVGDAFDKDIRPGKSLGCKTIWLKGTEWQPKEHDLSQADRVITSLGELKDIFKKTEK